MAETPLAQAERHIASLEKSIEQQKRILRALIAMNDTKGVALANDVMTSFQVSLALALEHRDHLARRE